MANKSVKRSHLLIDNPEKYSALTHRKMRVMMVSAEHPNLVVETEIYLQVNPMGYSNMVDLDNALNAIHIKRGKNRLYWQAGPKNLLPVFNYITLSSALLAMGKSNNILYIVKKDTVPEEESYESKFIVSREDRDLILQIASSQTDDPNFTGFTRFEESTHLVLACAGKEEHLPLKSKVPETTKKPTKADKSSAKTERTKTAKSKA